MTLRSLIRHRDNLIQARSVHIQHMQKALHLMNLQLDNVIADITGMTGLRILRAIVAGERDLDVLSNYRDPNCKNPREVIRKSLEGHYQEEYLFQLRQSLDLFDYYNLLLSQCDLEIEKHYAQLPPKVDVLSKPLPPAKKNRKRPRRNQARFDLRTKLYQMAGVDLTAIDGCNATTIQVVLSETGVNMSAWKTCRHFTSWLGLCPQNDVSGGKVLNSKTRKTKNRANTALRLAAQGLHHSDSWLGGYYRRQRARLGAPKSVSEKLFGCQSAQHKSCHRQVNHVLARVGQSLVIFAQPSKAIEPSEGALDNPPLGQQDEAFLLGWALDDVQANPAVGSQFPDPLDQSAGVAAIGPDLQQAREAVGDFFQHQAGAGRILRACGMHDRHQHQTQRIHQQMALAPLDLLGCVIAAF